MRLIVIMVTLMSLSACAEKPISLQLLPSGSHAMTNDTGEYTVLNYWAIWCAPCRREIPELNEFDHLSADVTVVGVNWDRDDADTTLEYMERMGIEFPVTDGDPLQQLAIIRPEILPTTFVFDANGRLVATLVGEQDGQSIRAAIESAEHSGT
ncbi:TlpA family protein disulfide reductase [Umboniibacter marinipuniceus]|uniref:Thiol-disulfide isomerase/thioredoxin n=1 Tax=Umboniibacter marinipuniceus TaxID=569599 RepID=A0A3M0A1H8_9GAMM|nr:TlpA disulfide reductase family protein [Umboniibacter marinipuniceus]RMA78813.1 thiol-disulfide isomerase/thioredoxin [Umboniibacter marinipuniceus]